MNLSNDQKVVLNSLQKWYLDENKRQYVTVGGYAGTGKTTLISLFKEWLLYYKNTLRISFCSYTGRATQNLKNRLKDNLLLKSKDKISTIHGLIYDPIESPSGEIVGWMKKDDLDTDLIIVDEASMVDETIWWDLLSYKIPIILVGDHGQLPPINGKFNLMEDPELVLTEIHRQEQNNPIIAVSIFARQNGHIPVDKYGPKVIKYSQHDPDAQEISGLLLESYNHNMLILCGYNKTRNKINQYIRSVKGFENPYPESGDRVICLRNNNIKGIYNGMLGTIKQLIKKDKDWYSAEIQMDDSELPYTGNIYAPQFGAETGINFTQNRLLASQGDLFDFGYALTVHKAQGSQAKKVVIFEERFKQMDDDMWKRWLYTGVTRAEEELYIFGL